METAHFKKGLPKVSNICTFGCGCILSESLRKVVVVKCVLSTLDIVPLAEVVFCHKELCSSASGEHHHILTDLEQVRLNGSFTFLYLRF